MRGVRACVCVYVRALCGRGGWKGGGGGGAGVLNTCVRALFNRLTSEDKRFHQKCGYAIKLSSLCCLNAWL